MKDSIVVHPFFSIGNPWPLLIEVDDCTAPVTPEPPKPPEPSEDPGEPDPEYPFWTYFIENPRPNS